MSFQYVWDSTFESLPDNNTYGYLIDDYFRQLYIAIRERMKIDHIWAIGETDGGHNKVSLAYQAAKPTAVAGYNYIYSKDVGAGVIETFIEDVDGNETQLTNAGGVTAAITAALLAHLAIIYPIGCIYTTTVATDPATVFGFGTWVAFGKGEVLVGKADAGTFVTAGATGGEDTHSLS